MTDPATRVKVVRVDGAMEYVNGVLAPTDGDPYRWVFDPPLTVNTGDRVFFETLIETSEVVGELPPLPWLETGVPIVTDNPALRAATEALWALARKACPPWTFADVVRPIAESNARAALSAVAANPDVREAVARSICPAPDQPPCSDCRDQAEVMLRVIEGDGD